MKYRYKFSVIIPLYNVENYLEEALNSVIEQSIGFEKNIQVILIDDGSEDHVEEICKKYEAQYPDNIIYRKQENQGVSVARNHGMQYIEGKYTNFLDGDDTWEKDAFSIVWGFFEENEREIDLVAGRQRYFEGKTGYTSLDYKYEQGDFIADIHRNPDYVQFSVTSAFFKSEALKGYRFDPKLKYAEDAKFITQILLEKEKYGILKSAVHNFRKRVSGTSVTQNKRIAEAAYIDTAKYYYQYLLELSKEKYGEIIPYVQYAVINAIKYRVGTVIPDEVRPEIRVPYIDIIIGILKQIDDEVILTTNRIVLDTRLYLLKLKYGNIEAIAEQISYSKGNLLFNNCKICPVFGNRNLCVDQVEYIRGKTIIRGIVKYPICIDNVELFLRVRRKNVNVRLQKRDAKRERKSFNKESMNRVRNFEVSLNGRIPIHKFRFFTIMDNERINLPLYSEVKSLNHQLKGGIINKLKRVIKKGRL